MIIIKKLFLKTMFVAIERNFLKKNDITSTDQFWFGFVTNRGVKNVLIMFIEVKNINGCSIFSFSYNSNESDMISFINVIFFFKCWRWDLWVWSEVLNLCNSNFEQTSNFNLRASIFRKNYNAQMKC